jgi:hypothetical protein
MSGKKPKKMVIRSVAIALGIICIVLVSGLVGVFAFYMPMISGKDNTISSLNLKISQANTNNTNLQDLVNQLQAWVDGNETLLNQTETWLDGNITYYAAQIESLNSEIATLNNTISFLTSFPNIRLHMTYEQFFEWTGHNETTFMTWNITGLQDGLVDLQVSSYNVDVNASDNSAIITVANDNWTVDLSNREIVNSTNNPQIIGFDCPFWIEKNVTVGSVINTLYGQATITGSQTLNVLGQQRDCWIVPYEWPTSSMVRWYDKATGIVLLIQVVRQEQGISILSNETATETNIFPLSQDH